MLFYINLLVGMFILADIVMEKLSIQGRYYINHFIGNMAIVYYTYDCIISSFTHNNIILYESIDFARIIIYSIHFYHILWYYNKLRYDDWLHHIVMVGITLPLTHLLVDVNLLGFGFFFVTGLPGGVDYLLLALVRNNMIDRMIEKQINLYINMWIRCPGCISNVTLGIVELIKNYDILVYSQIIVFSIMLFCTFWNGVYFMTNVVSNYAIETHIYKKN